MIEWIYPALLGAATVHIFEEYVYPGGFPKALKNHLPGATHLLTPGFHLTVNGLFLLLCLCSAIIGEINLVLSLSVFSLIFTNAILHIRGAILAKGHYPGVISGALIYIPLAVYTYAAFLVSGRLTWIQASLSILLGALYMATLMGYVLLQLGRVRR